MNPSRLFILRPVATSLLMIAVVIAGVLAYRLLPLSTLPEIDYPTIQVTTLYPGASPEVITSTITAPLETQFGQMPGLNQMHSTSSAGASVITLQFVLNVTLDTAQQEVQAAMNAAANYLPQDLPSPPTYSKFNPADAPVITLGITSATLPLTEVQDLVDSRIAQKLSQLSGVGRVTLNGGQRPAIRVRANPRALAAYNMDMETLRSAITTANSTIAKGGFDGAMRASTIEANGQIESVEEFSRIVVGVNEGSPIRLSDVAEVTHDAENVKLAAWANGKPSILLNVYRQPGANVIQVADRIHQLLPQLQGGLPAAVEVSLLADRTVTIRASVTAVQFELALAMVLVVLVIYVFLRNASATLIPGIAVPISIIGTFSAMYLLGYSLNNLTLMALTIATGFVVDDAIVMTENIIRYLEKGIKPLDAALKGAAQIGFTIISLTVSLIAVLIPLLFMGDVIGRLFHEFALTLAVSIVISCFISLSLTPMLCAQYLRANAGHTHGPYWNGILALYRSTLLFVLARQRATLVVAVCTLVLTVILYILIPKGFFPEQDTGLIQGILEAREDISFASMSEKQSAMMAALSGDPAVSSISVYMGVDGTNNTPNTSRFAIVLMPHDQRESMARVLARLKDKAASVSDVSLYLQPIQDLSMEDRVTRGRYQFTLVDIDMKSLEQATEALSHALQARSELADVNHDLFTSGLRAQVTVDRDAAARLGITMSAVDNVLYSSFGQRLVSTIFTQSNQYRVVLEVKPEFQQGVDALRNVYVVNQQGKSVPLTSFANISEGTAQISINHHGQFPAATLSFNLPEGVSLGQATDAIREAAAASGMPASTQLQLQGAARAFEASLSSTVWLMIAAIITMYIVLGILYESYIHPVTILSTLPSAAIGALLSLMLAGQDLGIVAIIGIILLIGIVKKNAIMMIDFALSAQREENLSPQEAIFQACLLRLRPILMTTMAALLAALPLMFAGGAGSELRQPLGISLVGGLVLSQILTLYTTPVIYLWFEKLRTHLPTDEGEPDLFKQEET